ncbi:MAG TPA: hypothetical protein VMR62_00780 [Bryobacteraceae bacterium]|nr:hypothetical protein [Bryobacteraceae bacterium]
MRKVIDELLPARGALVHELDQKGCVCAALAPALNPRLASQQGVFLLNMAGDRGFNESLVSMMEPCNAGWCSRFDIAADAVPEIEQALSDEHPRTVAVSRHAGLSGPRSAKASSALEIGRVLPEHDEAAMDQALMRSALLTAAGSRTGTK